MDTKIEKKKEINIKIYNPSVIKKIDSDVSILNIQLNEELTRIDFAVWPDRKYSGGWWVQIHKNGFIRPSGSDLKLYMVSAVNIPIAPTKYYFRNVNECLSYSLFFPPISKIVTSIDIIEKEAKDSNYFNFYGVSVETIKQRALIIPN